MQGFSVSIRFICIKCSSWSFSHFHGLFFFNSFLSLSVFSDSFDKNLLGTGSHRGMILVLLFYEVTSVSILLPLFLRSVFIPFSSISCPNHFVRFMKNFDFLLLARYPAFSSLFRTSNDCQLTIETVASIPYSTDINCFLEKVFKIF